MDNKIKLLVTQEKFDEVFSIDDWFNFGKLPQKDIYNRMLQFVADDNDNYVTEEQAREMFKKIKKGEWPGYFAAFIKKVNEAFVNPTSGG